MGQADCAEIQRPSWWRNSPDIKCHAARLIGLDRLWFHARKALWSKDSSNTAFAVLPWQRMLPRDLTTADHAICGFSADETYDGGMDKFKTKVVLYSDGVALWLAPKIISSSCRFDVTYFPFDEQVWTQPFLAWISAALQFVPSLLVTTFTPKLSKSEAMRIGSIIIFHLSKLWKAKFLILCDVIFLVRQEKFDIGHPWQWRQVDSGNEDWGSIRSAIILIIRGLIEHGRPRSGYPICYCTSLITGRHRMTQRPIIKWWWVLQFPRIIVKRCDRAIWIQPNF